MSCRQVSHLVTPIINLQLSEIASLKSPIGNTFLHLLPTWLGTATRTELIIALIRVQCDNLLVSCLPLLTASLFVSLDHHNPTTYGELSTLTKR